MVVLHFLFLKISFSWVRRRIALNGRANCSHTQLRQLADFAPTCALSERSQIYMLNMQKRHHGHGMRAFACVVGANCNSPTLYFVHIVNSSMFQIRPRYKFIPYFQLSIMGGRIASMEGRIAIRPYACVIRTLANIM